MKRNKMRFKFIIPIILAVIVIAGIIAIGLKSSNIYAAYTDTSNGNNVTYTLSKTTLKITGSGKVTDAWKNSSLNSELSNLQTSITAVSIAKTITGIEASAFENCTALEKVTFAASSTCTYIGNNAFKGCTALKNIYNSTTGGVIPKSVTTIGTGAFLGCKSMTTLKFAKDSGCTSIGNNAFEGCTALATFAIPDKVATIESNTFKGCTALETLTVGTGVTSIGKDAFKDAKLEGTLTYNAINCETYNNAFTGKQIGTVKIGSDVTVIPENFIKGNKAIKKIIIPDTVTNIKADAFNECLLTYGIIIKNKNCKIDTSSTISKNTTVFVKLEAGTNYRSFTGVDDNGTTFSTLLNWLYKNDKSYVPYAVKSRDTENMDEVSQSTINTDGSCKNWVSTLGDYGYKVGTEGGPTGTPRKWLFSLNYGTSRNFGTKGVPHCTLRVLAENDMFRKS